MKPKMVVHIGTPKTGTTTIQRALFDARMRMHTECDMLFATTERGNRRGRHISLGKAALGSPTEIEAEQRGILQDFERSGAGAVFMSDEALAGPQVRFARMFKRFTDEFDVIAVCYLRRQDYYAESLYNQAMRVRQFRNMPVLSDFWRDPNIVTRFDFHKILSQWSDIGAKVIARDFRKEVKEKGLLPSFQEAVGLQALGDLKAKDENLSQDLRLQLALCMLYTGHVPDEAKNLTRSLFRAGQVLVETGMFKPIKNAMGRKERNTLIEHFAESNEKLSRDYGIQFSDERPDEPEEPLLYPDGAYLMSLIGELTQLESVIFHRCAQSYLLSRVGKLPKQTLIDEETVDDESPVTDADIDGEVPSELLEMESEGQRKGRRQREQADF